MVGLCLGIVSVIGLISLTVYFLCKWKEHITKFDENLIKIHTEIAENRKNISYKGSSSDLNYYINMTRDLERVLREYSDTMQENVVKLEAAIKNINSEIETIKSEIETLSENVDLVDDIIAVPLSSDEY